MPTALNRSVPVGFVLVLPGLPQPGPSSTVGAGFVAEDASGNQCTRIKVPSNDVTS